MTRRAIFALAAVLALATARAGADLAVEPDPPRGAVRAGRRRRPDGAHPRRSPVKAPRPADRDREQAGRGRDARRRLRREGRARRLHAAVDHAGAADHQSVSDAEAALRSVPGFHRDRDGGDGGERAGGDAEPAGQIGPRADRLRQGQSGQAELLQLGRRRELASLRRAVQDDGRDRHRACAYRGSGPALQDLLAGNVQMSIDTVAVLLPHIQAGTLRALGVATIERNPTLPDQPPIADTLPGFDGSSINYINGPAGMPQPIVERLNREINAVLSDPDVAQAHGGRGLHADRREPARAGAAHRAGAGQVEEGDRADQIEHVRNCKWSGFSRPAQTLQRGRCSQRSSRLNRCIDVQVRGIELVRIERADSAAQPRASDRARRAAECRRGSRTRRHPGRRL